MTNPQIDRKGRDKRKYRPLAELCKLLKDSGAAMSFSANCISGILAGTPYVCRCWRCQGVLAQEEDPGALRDRQMVNAGESWRARMTAALHTGERLHIRNAKMIYAKREAMKRTTVDRKGRLVESEAQIQEVRILPPKGKR